ISCFHRADLNLLAVTDTKSCDAINAVASSHLSKWRQRRHVAFQSHRKRSYGVDKGKMRCGPTSLTSPGSKLHQAKSAYLYRFGLASLSVQGTTSKVPWRTGQEQRCE